MFKVLIYEILETARRVTIEVVSKSPGLKMDSICYLQIIVIFMFGECGGRGEVSSVQ